MTEREIGDPERRVVEPPVAPGGVADDRQDEVPAAVGRRQRKGEEERDEEGQGPRHARYSMPRARTIRMGPVAAILYLLTAVLCLALGRRVAAVSLRAAAVLVALPLLLTGSALLTGRIYAPIDLAYTTEPLASMAREVGVTHVANAAASDVYAQFVPWNAALRWAVAHHEWPLWNPFELGGNV